MLLAQYLTAVSRFPLGFAVGELGPRPAVRLSLYEFEGCPFCRKVREALSMLDLEATIYPCPKGGTRFRPTVVERGGKAQFPYLIDPNASVALYESDAIIAHLYGAYGAGSPPLLLRMGPLTDVASMVASVFRAGAGGRANAVSRPAPAQPLELWSFEISPYSRHVREALSELEIPYVLHNVAKGSPSRRAFIERSGKMQVPYLEDPNTGKKMFESRDIVTYLHATYG
jgi:glutathione S-transferase